MFNFLKQQLQKIYFHITDKFQGIFSRSVVDEPLLKELEQLLIEADTGVKMTRTLIDALRKEMAAGALSNGADVRTVLMKELCAVVKEKSHDEYASVYLLVGINGSGKTTCASKLAHYFQSRGKKVLLVAGDTFRAAATEQLVTWAHRTGTEIVSGIANQDPASVIFQGCERYKKESFDILLIDTAGRLQTKANLMKELEKIKKIIARQLPTLPMQTLLTIDAMLGQNSLEQAKIFHESTHLDGVILTKMDGTGKGGIVFAIGSELHIPIAYLTFGEQLEQIKPFHAQEYVHDLLYSE